ncbi:MAG: hypothetical protein JWQ19_2247 [Subtercola sp.]|nr:hypothetical protein [Subtercola sp.]
MLFVAEVLSELLVQGSFQETRFAALGGPTIDRLTSREALTDDAEGSGIIRFMRFEPNSPLHNVGPRGPVGSIFNVIICGVILVGTLISGFIQGNSGFFFVTAIAIVMEVQFVRIMIRANRRYRLARKQANGQSTEATGE